MSVPFSLHLNGDHSCGRFSAMASPCEILFDCTDKSRVTPLLKLAYEETQRIERKFSRYVKNNLLYKINNAGNSPVSIDEETFGLLTFANTCYDISEAKFDITSGILRKAWLFNGSGNLPSPQQVEDLKPFIGWDRVLFDKHQIIMPTGFELDFGGIGKEYAVNKVATLLQSLMPQVSILVNFGGDIQVTKAREKLPYWQVGIDNPLANETTAIVNIANGGLATSGDANKYLLKDNVRYSHILDPTTGYPVLGAPRSVTVASQHCVQAGLLATLALLKGKGAESFLKDQEVIHWCYR
jgi:thiamine biosynthesis lipoprotein